MAVCAGQDLGVVIHMLTCPYCKRSDLIFLSADKEDGGNLINILLLNILDDGSIIRIQSMVFGMLFQ